VAQQVAAAMRANRWTRDVNFDWEEPSKVIRLVIDQNRARVLGISTQELAQFLNTVLSGQAVTTYRERDKQIDVIARGAREERVFVSLLKDLAVPVARGRTVPLSQVAELSYGFEQGIYWRRDRLPSITVRSDLKDGVQAPVVSKEVDAAMAEIRAKLPPGYRIETGGAIEDAGRGQQSIAVVAPIMILVMVTALMLQLQSFSRLALVLLTAPLGIIGVAAALLIFNVPFGFVAMLGTDRPGHPRRQRSLRSDRRRDRAPLPPDHAHRCGGDPRHDPAHAQRVLRADGGRHHGRPLRGDGAHAALPAGALCRVVPHPQDGGGHALRRSGAARLNRRRRPF
jgi:multidrug efflux pump subunit AcrB